MVISALVESENYHPEVRPLAKIKNEPRKERHGPLQLFIERREPGETGIFDRA
jgi:hypothetical protein